MPVTYDWRCDDLQALPTSRMKRVTKRSARITSRAAPAPPPGTRSSAVRRSAAPSPGSETPGATARRHEHRPACADRFDHAVVGAACSDFQVTAEPVDRLVVDAGHESAALPRVQAGEPRTGLEAHRLAPLVVELRIDVADRVRLLGWNVLPQAAAGAPLAAPARRVRRRSGAPRPCTATPRRRSRASAA